MFMLNKISESESESESESYAIIRILIKITYNTYNTRINLNIIYTYIQ